MDLFRLVLIWDYLCGASSEQVTPWRIFSMLGAHIRRAVDALHLLLQS